MQINSMGFLNSQLDMAGAAKILAEYCADVKPGENVIIVSDDAQSRNVYMSLTAAAAAAGAEASLLLFPTPKSEIFGDRVESPKAVRSVLNDADAMILCGMKIFAHGGGMNRFGHPDFYDLVRGKESTFKGRVLMMTGMTEESIIRTIPVDYEAIHKETARLIELFDKTRQIHITCPKGSDVSIDFAGCPSRGNEGTFREVKLPMASLSIKRSQRPMQFLPVGRIGSFFTLDNTTNGIIKLKSFLGLGITYGTINLEVKDSRVIGVKGEGAEQWYVDNLRGLLSLDKNANFVSEVGIGLNPAARLTGCYEDYGLLGSVRFGFGTFRFPGLESVFHSDGFILGGTMELDGKALIRDGEYV